MKQEEFAEQIAIDMSMPYEDAYATVQLLYMDGKFDESIKRFKEDKTKFYLWATHCLEIIHYKLNF